MFVPALSSLLAYYWFWLRRLFQSRLNHRGRLEPYGEGYSAAISSQVDFLPSPSEFTAATR